MASVTPCGHSRPQGSVLADFFVPTISFSVDLQTDPTLKKYEVVVAGRKFDLSKAGQKVRVSGPRDRRICPICIRFVGNVYDRDDPRIQMFGVGGGGAHPRCRHYLTPVGIPGLDRERSLPGTEYVERLIEKGDSEALGRLYGKGKAGMLLSGEISLDDIYRPDGTVKNLVQLRPLAIIGELSMKSLSLDDMGRLRGYALTKNRAGLASLVGDDIADLFLENEDVISVDDLLTGIARVDIGIAEDVKILPAAVIKREVARRKKGLKQSQLVKKEVREETARARALLEEATELTPDEIEAIRAYKSRDYAEMNNYLRGEVDVSEDIRAKVSAMKTAVDAHVIPSDMTLYRGIESAGLLSEWDNLEGTIVADAAFNSTSIDVGPAQKFARNTGGEYGIVLKIEAKAGQKGLWTQKKGIPGESELVLPAGSRYRVLSADDSETVRLLTVELLE